MRRLIVAALILGPLFASAESYEIDAAHSKIAFQVQQFLATIRGEFHKFSGKIEFDREHPERSSVTTTIQVPSIDTKIRKRDDHLRSADFFNAAKYPEITFRSRSVKQTGPGSGDITGDFTMHGVVTRSMTLHVKLATTISGDSLPTRTHWLVTTDPIHRKDFALMFSGTAEAVSGIGQDVVPSIEIEATRAR